MFVIVINVSVGGVIVIVAVVGGVVDVFNSKLLLPDQLFRCSL